MEVDKCAASLIREKAIQQLIESYSSAVEAELRKQSVRSLQLPKHGFCLLY